MTIAADASDIESTLRDSALNPPRASLSTPWPGCIRVRPEDFQVDEDLGFAPSGEGEHALLLVEKRELNTPDAARALARAFGIAPRDVGYAGLKDRHAVTRQWFSVPARAAPEVFPTFDRMRVLDRARHRRKLKRGALAGNRFRILVRTALTDTDPALKREVARVREQGVPNYFGRQRFGIAGGNIARAMALFAGRAGRLSRTQRSLALSAARAALFNHVLARRVRDASWCSLLPGEVAMLDASNSFFAIERPDAALEARLSRFDIHPSGPLWGRGAPLASAEAAAVEHAVLAGSEALRDGLERAGLEQERRALRLVPRELRIVPSPGNGLWFEFALARGCYATSVLRELFTLSEGACDTRADDRVASETRDRESG